MPFGTGPNDPWYYNSFMDIGPFTGSDQSNMSVQQKVQLLRGLPALNYPTQAPPALSAPATPRQQVSPLAPVGGNPYSHDPFAPTPVDPNDVAGSPPTRVLDPSDYKNWTNSDTLSYILHGGRFHKDDQGNTVPSKRIVVQSPPPPAQPSQAQPAQTPNAGIASLPGAPTVSVPGVPDLTHAPVVYSSPDSGGDTATVPAAPPSDDISDTVKKLQTVLKIMGYPEAPSTSNPKQDAADAYAAHELDRTKLLAQLAFASGLTASAGGGYADIGKGFAAAANVYDQGQARYLKALQGSADRYTEQQKQAYDYQAKKAGTVADLYSLGEKQKLEQAKLARDYAKDRQDIMLRMSAQLLPKPSDSALTTMDPQTEQRRQQQLYRFWNTHNLSFDVSDQ